MADLEKKQSIEILEWAENVNTSVNSCQHNAWPNNVSQKSFSKFRSKIKRSTRKLLENASVILGVSVYIVYMCLIDQKFILKWWS